MLCAQILVFLILVGGVRSIPVDAESADFDPDPGYRRPKFQTIYNAAENTTIIRGVGCGFHTMSRQQVIEISSSNYGVAVYNNADACVWKFKGEDCGVSVKCPCFDVPASFQCFGDYLKFTDLPIYDQKFCGDVAPQGIYRSVTGHYRIRFRSDFTRAGKGFLCYVSCTAAGLADPLTPSPVCFSTAPAGTYQCRDGMAPTPNTATGVCADGSTPVLIPDGEDLPVVIQPSKPDGQRQAQTTPKAQAPVPLLLPAGERN